MDDLTDAQRSRLWATLKQLDHQFRTKRIGPNECIRRAYLACVHEELSHGAALTMLVRDGLALRWLAAYYPQTGRAGGFRRFGVTQPPVPPPQPIPEAEWRAVICKLVADLTQEGKRLRATKEAARYPVRAKWLRAQLAERGWNEYDLAAQSGPDPKTTKKVLGGSAVREGVLEKLALALSRERAKVELAHIPRK